MGWRGEARAQPQYAMVADNPLAGHLLQFHFVLALVRTRIHRIQFSLHNRFIVYLSAFLKEWATSAQVIDVHGSSSPAIDMLFRGRAARQSDRGHAGGNWRQPCICMWRDAHTDILRDLTGQHLWERVQFGPNQNIRWAAQRDVNAVVCVFW